MGCGASKVDPSIKEKANPKERPNSTSSAPEVNNNKKITQDVDRPLSRTKILSGRPASSSPKLSKSPKKSLVRDSNGSIKVERSASSASVRSDPEKRPPSSGFVKRESQLSQARVDLFAAKPPTPPAPIKGDNPLKPKPLAFDVPLEKSNAISRPLPPRRLVSLSNPPKVLTEKELEDKMRLKEEKRQLELERKKLKSSRMSRRKRDLIAARELSKQQDQAEEIKSKMQSTDEKRERLQAEKIEKQRRHKEHAEKVRERARRIKAGEDVDEGLGAEMETYKSNSDDGGEDSWIADDREITTKPYSSKSKSSHASLDTVDSGLAKLKNDVDDFYNA